MDFLDAKKRVETSAFSVFSLVSTLLAFMEQFKVYTHPIFQNFHFHCIFLKTKLQEYENTFKHSEAEQKDLERLETSSKVTFNMFFTWKESKGSQLDQ